MSKKAELAIKGLGKAYEAAKKLFKPKPSPVINSVKPGKRLKEKRDIQDSVVKSKDKTIAVLNEEGKRNVRTKVKLSDTNKKIADIVDKK